MTFEKLLNTKFSYLPPDVYAEAVRVRDRELLPQDVLAAPALLSPPPPTSLSPIEQFKDPRSLFRVFSVLEPLEGGAWPRIGELLFGLPPEKIGVAAVNCFRWFRRWSWTQNSSELHVPMRIWTKSSRWPRRTYAEELAREFQAIAARLSQQLQVTPGDASLRLAVLLFGWRGYMGRAGQLNPEMRRRVVDEGLKQLREFRMAVRNATQPGLGQEHVEQLEAALRVVVSFQSLWAGLKELLQALRFCPQPCVTSSLSYEPTDGADPVWGRLPFWLDALLFTFGFIEVRGDQNLIRTRTAYASYCADRLDLRRSKKRRNRVAWSTVEPSDHWRTSYVRALIELQQPLEGRVPAVLADVVASDPSPAVRKAASKAIKKLASSRKSPIQGLYASNWWMRRAHILQLGHDFDASAARQIWKRDRYRARELGSEFKLSDPDVTVETG
jgi:hypothetical protein